MDVSGFLLTNSERIVARSVISRIYSKCLDNNVGCFFFLRSGDPSWVDGDLGYFLNEYDGRLNIYSRDFDLNLLNMHKGPEGSQWVEEHYDDDSRMYWEISLQEMLHPDFIPSLDEEFKHRLVMGIFS